MGFFDKKHEDESPIGNLRAHIGRFMYFVKVGKSKFKHKGRIGEIFADMDNTQFLFQQATSGTMYDFKKKLDYALWDAAVHKYTEDIAALKEELLKVVDGKAEKPPVLEKEEEKKEEEAPKALKVEEESGDWRASIKDQMSEAEEKAKAEEERKKHEAETAVETVDFTEEMTEADCRELWRILQGLEREFRDMKDIANDWFTVHGKGNGCMGALAVMTLLPVGVIYGVLQVL